jgi:hypothetical protein
MRSKGVAHIWTGNDTVCRMCSTGGLKRKNYIVVNEKSGREVCSICLDIEIRKNV